MYSEGMFSYVTEYTATEIRRHKGLIRLEEYSNLVQGIKHFRDREVNE